MGRRIREDRKLRAWVEAGRPFAPYDNRPRLWVHLAPVWNAFWELGTCRMPSDWGTTPIPWTAIHAWCEDRDVRDRGRFVRLIRKMDETFLDLIRSERKEE